MPPPLRITSDDNPRIKRVLHLRKNRDRRSEGVLIAEGKREIERALAAGLKLRQLFICPELTRTPHDLVLSLDLETRALPDPNPSAPEIVELPQKLFLKMAYLERPEGLLAIIDQPTWTLDRLPAGDLYLIATGIEKPGNLGAMARTASAAGCAGMIVADENVDAFNPNAIRASTGAVFSLPIVTASSEDAIQFCRHRGIQIVAAIVGAKTDYADVDWKSPSAVVIGSEDVGLPPIWQSAGVAVRIPMAEGVVDSLNASTSAAILLFEAVKQKKSNHRGTATQRQP